MTPDQQRVAIAKFLGWNVFPDGYRGEPPGMLTFTGAGCPLPDYCNSLDAIAEAYTFVRQKDRALYWQLHKKLDGIVAAYNSQEGNESLATADASAAQRCAAFCKVLNLEPKK